MNTRTNTRRPMNPCFAGFFTRRKNGAKMEAPVTGWDRIVWGKPLTVRVGFGSMLTNVNRIGRR